MLNLPLNAIRALAYVYQANGVRSAAREMGIAHSAVSRHIHDLEAWLGIKLLENQPGRKKLVFTASGQRLAESALHHFQSLDDQLTAMREARHDHSLVISTTESFAARWLMPRLSGLSETMPDLEVSVQTEQRIVEPDGLQVDIAIRMGQGRGMTANSQAFMDDCLFPVVHPELLKACESNPARLFASVPLIHDRDEETQWKRWIDAFPVAGLDYRKGPRFTSSDLTIKAAKNRLGIALVRGRLVADELAKGTLVRPFGDRQVSLKQAYWISQAHRAERREITARVVEWLFQQANL